MNSLMFTLGRIVFAVPFAVSGVLNLVWADQMAGYVPIPGGVFWIYVTGLALIAGSLGIVTGWLGQWAALGIALLMLVFVLTLHIPGLFHAQSQQTSLFALIKDTALLGGALTIAGNFRRAQD